MKKQFLFLGFLTLALMVKAQIPTLTVQDLVVTPGATNAIVEVVSDKPLNAYVGYQFDLVLPSFLTPVADYQQQVSAEQSVTVTAASSGMADGHQLVYRKVGENAAAGTSTYRFLCYSSTNKHLTDARGVLSFKVDVSDSSLPGLYAMYIDDTNESASSRWALKVDANGAQATPGVSTDPTCTVNASLSYQLKAAYGTLILPFASDLPLGLRAFSCNGTDEGFLVLDEVTSLQANTPYIMSGTQGTYSFAGIPAHTQAAYTVGLLTGVLEDTPAPVGSYVLQNHTAEGLAFYPVTEGTVPTVKANRCYLTLESGQAPMLRLGGTTVVCPVEAESSNIVHDLLGRRVESPIQKGVYIVDGKKVLVK